MTSARSRVWSCQSNYNEAERKERENSTMGKRRSEVDEVRMRRNHVDRRAGLEKKKKKSAGCRETCQLNSPDDYLFNAMERRRSIENDQT